MYPDCTPPAGSLSWNRRTTISVNAAFSRGGSKEVTGMQETEQHLPAEWCNAVDENIQSGLSELWILSLLAERDM